MYPWSDKPEDPSLIFSQQGITEITRQAEKLESQEKSSRIIQDRYTERLSLTDRHTESTSTILEAPDSRLQEHRYSNFSAVVITPYNQRLPTWRRKQWDTEESPDQWSNRREFIAAGLACTFDIPGIAFFVSRALEHGGSYLYAYIIATIFMGIPVFFFEVALGQFTGSGPLKLFALIPLVEGLGYSMIIYTFIESIRYAANVAIFVFYFFATFNFTWDPFGWKLPWSATDSANGSRCEAHKTAGLIYLDQTVFGFEPGQWHGPGVQWQLIGCLAFTCTILYLGLLGSIKVAGKVMLFVVPFVFLLLIVMAIPISFQSGAEYGLRYLFTPTWDLLSNPKIWGNAISHVFFSYGMGGGVPIWLGSCSRFQSPLHIDTLIICLSSAVFNLCFVIVTFGGFGVLCFSTKEPIDIQQLYALTKSKHKFIIFSGQIMNVFPFPPIWSVIYFLMVSCLGITSLFLTTLTISRTLYAFRPSLRTHPLLVNLAVVTSQFLIAILFVSKESSIVDQNLVGSMLPQRLLIAFEVLAFVFGYGLMRLRGDLIFMLHFDPNRYYRYTWIASPFILIFIHAYSMVDEDLTKITDLWLVYLIAFIMHLTLLPLTLVAIYKTIVYYRRGTLRRVLRPPDDISQTIQEPIEDGTNVDCIHAFFRRSTRIVPEVSDDQQLIGARCMNIRRKTNTPSTPERIRTKSTLNVLGTNRPPEDTLLSRKDQGGHSLTVLNISGNDDPSKNTLLSDISFDKNKSNHEIPHL